ncbi:hypothetical protein Tco_0962458, partial [Tanacetum coccineum]
KANPAHAIDWNDPTVLKYHTLQNRPFSKAEVRKNMCMYLKNHGGYKQSHFRGMSYEDIRPIFERVWDQNQAFVPKDSEIEKEVMKRPGFDLQKQPAEEEKLQKNDDSSKPFGGSRKKTLARKKSRADGGLKNYKIFSEMLDDFDRQDVMDLHRLVEERYATSRPEGYDLMLWGDLKILFQLDKEDEVWRHQHEYNLISYRLFDSCGIHILLMDNGIAIHMMIEKKYP